MTEAPARLAARRPQAFEFGPEVGRGHEPEGDEAQRGRGLDVGGVVVDEQRLRCGEPIALEKDTEDPRVGLGQPSRHRR